MNTINQTESQRSINTIFSWSFGKDIYDNKPTLHKGTWEEFISFINSNKAARKGHNYIASPFGGDGLRRKDNALPRLWLPFDIDCKMLDTEARSLALIFKSFKCIGYQTASSLPDARRMRYIAKLTRPVDELEAGAVGHLLESIWGVGEFDKSVYRPSQPIFLPPIGQKVFTFNGDTIDPDEVLKVVKIKPKGQYKRNHYENKDIGDAYAFFAGNGLIKQTSGGMHKVRCPWVHEHTDHQDNGTVLYDPSPKNNMLGGFVCLHSHCENRSIGDVFRIMEHAQ